MQFPSNLLKLKLAWLACLFSDPIQAQDFLWKGKDTIENSQKDYVFLNLNQSIATGTSKKSLGQGLLNFGFDYLHDLNQQWRVGAGYTQRTFLQENGDKLYLLTIRNHTQKTTRIYHPFYLGFGLEWTYMIPTNLIAFPLKKDPDYVTEIGIGACLSLWYELGPHWIINWENQYWRGTKTSQFQGFESSLGLGFGF